MNLLQNLNDAAVLQKSESVLSYPKDMYVRRYAELVSELAYEY